MQLQAKIFCKGNCNLIIKQRYELREILLGEELHGDWKQAVKKVKRKVSWKILVNIYLKQKVKEITIKVNGMDLFIICHTKKDMCCFISAGSIFFMEKTGKKSGVACFYFRFIPQNSDWL